MEQTLDADKALIKLGVWGRYQIFVYLLTSATWFFSVFQMMSMAFLAQKPLFDCTPISHNETKSINQWKSHCNFHDNATGLNIDCDRNDTYVHLQFDKTMGHTLAIEFKLVCDRSFLNEMGSSLFMFGLMCGAFIIPQMADRYGRRICLLGTSWFMFLSSSLAAVMPNFSSFCAMRFLTGVCYGAIVCVGWILGCECVAPEMRAYGTLFMGVFWTAGYCLVGLLAYLIDDWRYFEFACSLPLLLSITYYWFMPESLHWYVATNRHQRAIRWVTKAEKFNKVKIDIDDCMDHSSTHLTTNDRPTRNMLDLLRTPILLCQTLISCYLWSCNTFIYYGLSLFSTNLAGDRYFNFVLSGIVEAPAYLFGAPILNKFGRKRSVIFFHALAGISLLVLMFIPENTENGTNLTWLITSLWLLGKFSITFTFASIFVYGAEIFPTTVRSAGLGLCGVGSRVGGIIAPYARLMDEVSHYLPPTLFGVSSIIAALLACFLPETYGKKLPEDIDDVDPGPLVYFFPQKSSKVENITEQRIPLTDTFK